MSESKNPKIYTVRTSYPKKRENFDMAKVKEVKVSVIEVDDILRYNRKVYLESELKVKARHELCCFLKELAMTRAARLSGFVLLFRGSSNIGMSDNLTKYIRSLSNFALRRILFDLIVECYGGGYSSFSMFAGWGRLRKGLFHYYYFKDKDYKNVYTISDVDLPRYINHNFSKEDKEVFLNRLRGLENKDGV
jgi:hypothetical protein